MDTYLFPAGLDFGRDVDELASTPDIQSCFLRSHVRMSGRATVNFAKALEAAEIYSVGDFLHLTRDAPGVELKPASVLTLDRYLGQFSGLPENQHAPGTVVPTWLPGATALAHSTGVVILSISRGRLHECSVMHRHLHSRCWFATLAALGPCAGVRACEGRSTGWCRGRRRFRC